MTELCSRKPLKAFAVRSPMPKPSRHRAKLALCIVASSKQSENSAHKSVLGARRIFAGHLLDDAERPSPSHAVQGPDIQLREETRHQ